MKYDVSVVIICMNNYAQLADCLDSIKKYTTKVSYEVLLVAYFFSPENLAKLRENYPWVKIIESNEIRGFSANNNLALRQAQGEYCFVVNDDTYMQMPVIDMMYARMKSNPEVTILSPQIIKPDGKIQYKGMTPINWKQWLKVLFKLMPDNYDPQGEWTSEAGFFRTYNVLGAAFFMPTDYFREIGFLDERYFYGPEDRALSTLVNNRGGKVYVDSDIKIVHLGGGTAGPKSKTACATRPANRKGWVIYLDEGKESIHALLCTAVFLNSAIWSLGWLVKRALGNKYAMISFHANVNVCRSIFSKKSTTEIFKKYYKKIKK